MCPAFFGTPRMLQLLGELLRGQGFSESSDEVDLLLQIQQLLYGAMAVFMGSSDLPSSLFQLVLDLRAWWGVKHLWGECRRLHDDRSRTARWSTQRTPGGFSTRPNDALDSAEASLGCPLSRLQCCGRRSNASKRCYEVRWHRGMWVQLGQDLRLGGG